MQNPILWSRDDTLCFILGISVYFLNLSLGYYWRLFVLVPGFPERCCRNIKIYMHRDVNPPIPQSTTSFLSSLLQTSFPKMTLCTQWPWVPCLCFLFHLLPSGSAPSIPLNRFCSGHQRRLFAESLGQIICTCPASTTSVPHVSSSPCVLPTALATLPQALLCLPFKCWGSAGLYLGPLLIVFST